MQKTGPSAHDINTLHILKMELYLTLHCTLYCIYVNKDEIKYWYIYKRMVTYFTISGNKTTVGYVFLSNL